MDVLLIGSISTLVLFLSILLFALFRSTTASSQNGGPKTTTGPEQESGQSTQRRSAVQRMRGGRHGGRTLEGAIAVDSMGSSEGLEEAGPSVPSKKQQKKEEKKKKKAERHEYEEEMREQRTRELSAKEAKYLERSERREAEERRQEEEAQRIQEEREKHDQLIYEDWKGQITVEDGGTAAEMALDESEGCLTEFVAMIQRKKVVVLEELAAELQVTQQDIVNRMQSLEAMGRITGVFDDRGKFIYISPEEMIKVSNYVNQRGRVSIADLTRASSTLIAQCPQ